MKTESPSQPVPTNVTGFDTEFLSQHSTKVMIQEAATRRYLSCAGVWTAELGQAMTFRSGSAAMEHLRQKKLANVRLVLTRAITVSEVIPVTNLVTP